MTTLPDANSQLAALTFKRVIHDILAIGCADSQQADNEVFLPMSEGTTGQNGFVFASESMLKLLRTVRQVAATDVCVLITGETGTGKEVIAQTIHEYSRRATCPLFTLNCAAVPRDLIESQMFGHRKGAFSGAIENYQGIARSANGGTLFLDEIGEIPFDMQAKLLRFLELNEVHTIGEPLPTKVDVRLIFATNDDLEQAVAQNRFRRDLFYRMNIIPMKVPPLRERREEIPILVNFFAQRFASKLTKEPVRFSAIAMQSLIFYSWPGNVRQLSNEVRRLTTLAESGAYITPDDLSQEFRNHRPDTAKSAGELGEQMTVRIDQRLDKATELLESAMIKHALRQSKGHVATAANTLGISRKGLYLKRVRLGLENFNPETTSP